jgi:ribosome-binding protein aMBF1 (putative translation factor)
VVVAFNEQGFRIRQSHHNAWIPDVIVDLIRWGHEDYGWGYLQLAAMFFLSKNTVRKICTYERRAQTAARYKTVRVKVG